MTALTTFRTAALAVLALAAAAVPAAAQQSYDAPAQKKATAVDAFKATSKKEFYIVTLHVDGRTGTMVQAPDPSNFFPHPAEAFPAVKLPEGGGLVLKGPNDKGDWQMRAFAFSPAQVVVQEGDWVTLNFVGSQGPAHRIAVEGVEGEINLKRGETKAVELVASKPGIIRFASLDRLPSMVGQILVLPKR